MNNGRRGYPLVNIGTAAIDANAKPSPQWYRLKLVRNAYPNEDGRWLERYLSEPPTYDTEIAPGWHIVQIEVDYVKEQPPYMHSVLDANWHATVEHLREESQKDPDWLKETE